MLHRLQFSGCFHLRKPAGVCDEHVWIVFVHLKYVGILHQACIGRLVRKFEVKMEELHCLFQWSLWPVFKQNYIVCYFCAQIKEVEKGNKDSLVENSSSLAIQSPKSITKEVNYQTSNH